MILALNNPSYLLLCLLVPVVWVMMHRSFVKDRPPGQKIIISGLRSMLIIILALALSDPVIKGRSDQVNVFFCLDVSESIPVGQRQAAQAFVKRATAEMKSEDQAGLIVFGKQSSLEVSLQNRFDSLNIRSDISPNLTSIYDALQLAIGKFPRSGQNKIVVFSDGNENLHNSRDMAYLAASLGIQIYPVPLATWFGKNEVFINALETPPHVALDTPFEIRLEVISSAGFQGELVLVRNESLLVRQSVVLQAGINILAFADTLVEPGLYLYRAIINSAEDTFFQNNEGLSFTRGSQQSRILYLADEDTRSQHLAEALKVQGLDIEEKQIGELPGTIHGFVDYSAIILDNISGQSISLSTMEMIEKYVRDLGGGLIMIGGDKSFGAGFYKKTPVEKALPLYMDAPTDIRSAELYLIFVIDKSSSMMTSYGGKSKLEIAKIAAFSSIEMLNPVNRVGIVAFDTEFEWIVPITPANERKKIAAKLSQLTEGGGTDLYPALGEVQSVLNRITSAKKHVIILSDGETEEADFQSLAQSMNASGISISTVAIGTGAHVDLMKSIARWGNGRSYFTDDPKNIPKIFAGETKIISKNIIAEKTMQPVLKGQAEMLKGIDDELPLIYGMVRTYPKAGANVLIETAQGPLLAAWQYGLGRSVAFTSDLTNRWGKDWVLWPHYGKFASQMVKWARRKEGPKRFSAAIDHRGEQGTFTVDINTDQNRFVNHLDLSVNVLLPSGKDQTFALDQTAPGRYESLFPAEEIGAYFFSVYDNNNKDSGISRTFGFGIPYTEEFNNTGVNEKLLQDLAATTNGRILSIDDTAIDLFTATSAASDSGASLWPYLVGLFLPLLVLDAALRKIMNLGDN